MTDELFDDLQIKLNQIY